MITSISKSKLPRGRSYVLKTSQLATALEDSGIETEVALDYWLPLGGESILEAQYWLPNQNVPYPRVYIRAGTVPSALRSKASEALLATALPEFIRWLRGIIEVPSNSPALHEQHYFNAIYTIEGLAISYQPILKVRR